MDKLLKPIPRPTKGVKWIQWNAGALIRSESDCDNLANLGRGILYITESHISWISSISGNGFSLSYDHISHHRVEHICPDQNPPAKSQKCITLNYDPNPDDQGSDSELSSSGHSQDPIKSDGYLTERSDIFFTVDDLELLDATYFKILKAWLSVTTQNILVAPKESPNPMEMLRQMNVDPMKNPMDSMNFVWKQSRANHKTEGDLFRLTTQKVFLEKSIEALTVACIPGRRGKSGWIVTNLPLPSA